MSNYDQNLAAAGAGDTTLAIDAGLRSFMLRIYNHMAAGVAVTALVAWLTYQLTGPALLQNPLMWVFPSWRPWCWCSSSPRASIPCR